MCESSSGRLDESDFEGLREDEMHSEDLILLVGDWGTSVGWLRLADRGFLPAGKGVGVEARELKLKPRELELVGVAEREGLGWEVVGWVSMNGKGLRADLAGVTGGSAAAVARAEKV
jgi:hypothetical protein